MEEYKDLFRQSVESQAKIASALEILKDTSKIMNDNLASHNKTIEEIYRLACANGEISKQNNKLLLKYLKWAIVGLIALLGGAEVLKQITNFM